MAKRAKGKKSYAISDISGFKVPYTQLKTTWNNLRVEPEEFETKHPQLTPVKNIIDATSLLNPRPDNDPENVEIYLAYNYDWTVNPKTINRSTPSCKGEVGLRSMDLFTSLALTGVGGLGETGAGIGARTYAVTVVDSGGNKFALDGSTNPVLTLRRGATYTFDQSDSTNDGHPLAFRTSADASYTSGVTVNGTAGQSGASVVFVIPSDAPDTLKYYCTVHGNGMGNTINVVDAVTTVEIAPVIGVGSLGGAGEVGIEGLRILASPTGLGGTGNVGSETPEMSITETGLGGTGGVGDEALELSITETGLAGTGNTGTAIIAGQGNVSGVAGSGGVGTVSLIADLHLSVSGVAGTGRAGNPGETNDESVQLSINETGLGGTGGVGSETVETSITETGVGGTGGTGDESVTVNQEWGSGTWGDGTWGN
jgi:hypothetical protein